MFIGSRKIPTLGSTVQWDTRQALFPTGTAGPRVGIFLSPLNTSDGFYLSHKAGSTRGKDKNEQSQIGCTLICDVTVMLKLCHHVPSQHIEEFLEVFFMFFQYKMGCLVMSKKENPLLVLVVGHPEPPKKILLAFLSTFWHPC